ncbi:MAG: phytase [Pseudohongiella sp.]|nr:phytase [Pseudohongiella sp.]
MFRTGIAIVSLLLCHNLSAQVVSPRIVTDTVKHDTDDPAIWINHANPAQSLIVVTDKDVDGALYVFDLEGKIQADKVIRGLLRPNNVDIAYKVWVGGEQVDIAVVAERYANRLRIYRLPDMAAIDGGGIPVFEGERARDVMGIALYTRPSDQALFAVVSRSDAFAPAQGYLRQYRLADNGNGQLQGLFTRAFGAWSGLKEVEAVAVDNELGYIYYSDEMYGVRKYQADPNAEDAEDMLAEFGLTGFARDHEGISIYKRDNGTGYILVSDQQANAFNIYPREGTATNPHEHPQIGRVVVEAIDSDGSEITHFELPGYPGGLFVVMSTDKRFHYYAVQDILAAANLPL